MGFMAMSPTCHQQDRTRNFESILMAMKPMEVDIDDYMFFCRIKKMETTGERFNETGD